MPVEVLACGVPTTLVQNQVYAIPTASTWLHSSLALEFGSLFGGPFTANAASTTGMQATAPFFRCPSGAAVVTFRK